MNKDKLRITIENEKEAKRKEWKNIAMLTWVIIGTFALGSISHDLDDYLTKVNNILEEKRFISEMMSGQTQPSYVEYNLKEIQSEVNLKLLNYFPMSCTGITTIGSNATWDKSFYVDNYKENKFIVIGIQDISKDSFIDKAKYETVYTHECVHYILHRLNLTYSPLHEALADLSTRYISPEGQKMLFGENNEGRYGAYKMISNTLIGKEQCLDKVFQYQIRDIDDMLLRLKTFCNISFTTTIFNKL